MIKLPQILLEYTANLSKPIDLGSMINELHNEIQNLCDVESEKCKTRVKVLNNFFIGQNQEDKAFIYLEIRIFEGRTQETKKVLAKSAINLIENSFAINIKKFSIDITIQIIDINKANYFKHKA